MPPRVLDNPFGKERARRYKIAMGTCPAARYLEVLPLFCMCARPEIQQWDVIDMGAGTGYLTSFFEGVARSVLMVDKSIDQLQASDKTNFLLADMSAVGQHIGPAQADLIICLASFHHIVTPESPSVDTVYSGDHVRYWTPERYLDVAACAEMQLGTLRDWCRILKPGGQLVLVDIAGYPDDAWDSFWPQRQPYTINTQAYHQQHAAELKDWPLDVDGDILARFFARGLFKELWETDQHLAELRGMLGRTLSVFDLIRTYHVPEEVLKSSGPMVPADFFDDIVDRFGGQPHFGYYARETSVSATLKSAGMEQIHTRTIPTPWAFDSKETAAWFVHELLGLGSAWERDAIPQAELNSLLQLLERYLGFYEDGYGRTMLYWQLGYFVARKPLV